MTECEQTLHALHSVRRAGERRVAPSWDTMQRHRNAAAALLLRRNRDAPLTDSERGRLLGILVSLADETDRMRAAWNSRERALDAAIDRATRRRRCVRV